MTQTPYRLAVMKTGGARVVVVEHAGRMLPLGDVLAGTDLAGTLSDLGPVIAQWDRYGPAIDTAVATGIVAQSAETISADGVQLAMPFASPPNLICIGANYHDHVAEMPIPMVPTQPYAFLKPTRNTLRGTGDAVTAPRHVTMFDFEAELAVVIGRACKDVTEADALAYVAGYCNFNDLSARDWIASRPPIGIDWFLHKGHDGFAPMGPYFLPARFVADPQDLPVRLSVNGVVKQDSTTAQMIYGVAAIIAHLSRTATLLPGDIIATGTPAGVGHGRHPPEYLKPGDEICMEIGALGRLVTPIV
ncbi:fumarylacetoacetate hydrolase family protein [Novosphingobium sp.]|uniref:fumarylacetoacetate hydrolase family protein n=1 Tax=Novosphingobium sp. TaxID=1874826 RepID=UPI003D0D3B6E